MTHDEILAHAASLALLDVDDLERREAEAHAQTCPECTLELRRGARLAGLIETAAPEPVSDLTLARVQQAIESEMAREDVAIARARRPPRWVRWIQASAVVAAWAVVRLMTAHTGTPREVMASMGVALVAAASAWLATLRASAVLLPLATSLVASLLAADRGQLHVHLGLRCAGIEVLTMAVPLAITAVVAWRRAMSAASFAVVAASGALAGQAVLQLACEERSALPHLLLFHTGTVWVAALVGLLVWRLPARVHQGSLQ